MANISFHYNRSRFCFKQYGPQHSFWVPGFPSYLELGQRPQLKASKPKEHDSFPKLQKRGMKQNHSNMVSHLQACPTFRHWDTMLSSVRFVLWNCTAKFQNLFTKISHEVLSEFMFFVGSYSEPSWSTWAYEPWAVSWTHLVGSVCHHQGSLLL